MTYTNIVFPNHLDLRYLGGTLKPDGETFYNWVDYMLLSEFVFISAQVTITVPALFVCDRASIPPFAQSVIQKDGSHQRPSIIHDWAFEKKGVPGCETFDLANDLLMDSMCGHRNLAEPTIIETPFLMRNAIMEAVSSPIGRAIWEDDD